MNISIFSLFKSVLNFDRKKIESTWKHSNLFSSTHSVSEHWIKHKLRVFFVSIILILDNQFCGMVSVFFIFSSYRMEISFSFFRTWLQVSRSSSVRYNMAEIWLNSVSSEIFIIIIIKLFNLHFFLKLTTNHQILIWNLLNWSFLSSH